MKRYNNIWKSKITFTNLVEAHNRAKKGRRFREDIINFDMDREANIVEIGLELLNNKYNFGKYREFYVYEPKKRCIKVLPYRDRIVHQLYVEEYIKPIFVKDFIKDSYACIKGRGVHKGVLALHSYMRKMNMKNEDYYILKCDIKNFFASVNHDKMYEILERRIKDKDFLKFTKKLVYCDELGKGLPIGNYTSQYFANIFLNGLDKFVKEELHVKYYVRYMDDFVLLLDSKSECKTLLESLKLFLEGLGLTLNPKTAYFRNKEGVNFCGYRIFNDKMILKTKSKTRLRRWLKKIRKMYAGDDIKLEEISRKLPSIWGHLKHCNSFKLYEGMLSDFVLVREEN